MTNAPPNQTPASDARSARRRLQGTPRPRSAIAGSDLVDGDLQVDDLADRRVPLLGAGLAAALAPVQQHDVLHQLGAQRLVLVGDGDTGHLDLLAERAGLLVEVAALTLLGGLG